MVVEEKRYTVDEFEGFIALPENADRLFELINGEIVEKMPTLKHGRITARLVIRVGNLVEEKKMGWIATEVRHRMPNDDENARLPDISFYSDTTRPTPERGPLPYMPELCIEIQSPDDSLKEMLEKAEYYLANGAHMVWLIYTEKQLIEVLTADMRLLLTIDETLEGGDVLPGFALPVRELFDI